MTEVERREARSGIGYSAPVELHDTTKSRVEFVSFFITRKDHEELACKILHYTKPGYRQKYINLNEPAARKLHEALGAHLAITGQDVGKYVIVRTDGSVDVSELGVSQIANAISQLLATDGMVDEIGRIDLGAEVLHALRTEFRLRELRNAVAELSNHLRQGECAESIYQAWCDQHSWAFGNAYVVNDELRSISASDKIDLLLPRHLGGFRDVIELKRPDKEVLVWDGSHKNFYFSADVSAAIGQCHRYLDVLHQAVGMGNLTDAPEVVAYHPRATIVIGRAESWEPAKQKALHGLNRRLSDISVMTYDHLLAQARRTLEMVEAPDAEGEVVVPSDDWEPDEDSDWRSDPYADFGEDPF